MQGVVRGSSRLVDGAVAAGVPALVKLALLLQQQLESERHNTAPTLLEGTISGICDNFMEAPNSMCRTNDHPLPDKLPRTPYSAVDRDPSTAMARVED